MRKIVSNSFDLLRNDLMNVRGDLVQENSDLLEEIFFGNNYSFDEIGNYSMNVRENGIKTELKARSNLVKILNERKSRKP